MKHIVQLLLPLSLLAGCASNSGIIPIGTDTYMVTRQAATGFSGSGTLKAEAFQEANAHCAKEGKALEVVSTQEAQPPFVFGNYPKAEVHFKCLAVDKPARGKANDQPEDTSRVGQQAQ